MEGIKQVAIAYYERATKEERQLARDYFKRLDENGDGKVQFVDFEKSANPWPLLSKTKIFKQLDVNDDGALDFNGVLALYYLEKKSNFSRSCNGCSDLLVGPFFSCSLCLPKAPDTVDLCCDCYRKVAFKHEHARGNFMDHHSLLSWFTTSEETTQRKREMQELRDVASAHYQAGSAKVKELANNFFVSMDGDGDGRIDLQEFLAFTKQEGHKEMKNRDFFNKLDKDGNETLDFMEVMTLYYIIKSGRPFCDVCGNFVPGTFFSCVECSFTQCFDCYRSMKSKHNHNGRAQFLDNYTLLQAKQESSLTTQNKPTPNVHHSNSTPNAATAVFPAPKVQFTTTGAHRSTAIVPAYKVERSKWDITFKALEAGIAIGNISSTLCTIL